MGATSWDFIDDHIVYRECTLRQGLQATGSQMGNNSLPLLLNTQHAKLCKVSEPRSFLSKVLSIPVLFNQQFLVRACQRGTL